MFLILISVIGLLAGAVGAALSAQLLIKPGPQGETGLVGPQGETGPEGPQGIPGVNGTDAILQVIQNRNETQVDVGSYTAMRWHNFSDLDSLMNITINISQNSKILAQFSTTQQMEPPSSIWVRIVVDNNYNSSTYRCSIGPSGSGTYNIPGHIEFLTDSLNAGSHTINAQFLRESGSPRILDRTLTVIEITPE
jgi:hypothetical protein